MPTFDFQCQKCSHVFEISRPYGSKVHPACPQCGNKKTEKLISPPLIQFKGSGFYKTDSTSKSAPKTKKTEAPSTPPTETKAPERSAPEKSENTGKK